jgi:hypothetical protein
MNSEILICLGTAAATICLGVLSWHWFRTRRVPLATVATLAIFGTHLVGTLLVGPKMRGYQYTASGSATTFVECPYKGVTYESMRSKHTMSNSDPELYRTFGKDWWNFYRWFDYATHPRWQLPQRSPTAEPGGAPNAALPRR